MTATTTVKKTKAARTFADMPTDYASLLAMHPPRLFEDKAGAAAAAAVLTAMGGHELNADQAAYAKLLGHLLADWRATHGPRPKRVKPRELVAAMMEEHELTQGAMAKILGITQGHVSLILKGERDLSKESIRKFADRFKIDTAALI